MSESSHTHCKVSTPNSNSEIEDEVVELTDMDKRQTKNFEKDESRPKNPITVQLQLLSQHFRNLWSSPLTSSSEEEILENESNRTNSNTLEIEYEGANQIQEDNNLIKIPDLYVDIIEEEVKKELEEAEKLEDKMNRNLPKNIKNIQPSLTVKMEGHTLIKLENNQDKLLQNKSDAKE